MEITNEANVPGSPETSDGSNPLIIEDLIAGVETAKEYARAHDPTLAVGFNLVFDYHLDLNDFWQQLKLQATPTFLHDVDFLGLHTYPNLGSAATPVNDSINTGEIDALQTARCEMTYLGLPTTVPIDITEVGYPVSSPGDYATRSTTGPACSTRSTPIAPTTAAGASTSSLSTDHLCRRRLRHRQPRRHRTASLRRDQSQHAKFDPATPHRPAPHPRAPLMLIRRARITRRIRSFRARPGHTYRIALHRRPGRIRVLAVTAHRRQETIVRPSRLARRLPATDPPRTAEPQH